MDRRQQTVERKGKTWRVALVSREEAAENDLSYWLSLTPDERVSLVDDCLLSVLKTQGLDAAPRLRRVHRRVERPSGQVAGGREKQDPPVEH